MCEWGRQGTNEETEHRTEWGAGCTAGLLLLREVLPAGEEAVSHAGLRGQSSCLTVPGRHSEEAGVAEAG